MISIRKISAIVLKQFKDTLKNKAIIIQFIIFPLLCFAMTKTIANKDVEMAHSFFAIMFGTMFASMIPIINISTIISEEKEHNTLRVLMLSNVKPSEYLLGIGSYVFFISVVVILIMGKIGGLSGEAYYLYIVVLTLEAFTSIFLGSAIGILAKNQMNASGISVPVSIILSFLPMLSMYDENIKKISNYLYTQQIRNVLDKLTFNSISSKFIIVVFLNFMTFLLIFSFAYRKKKFI